MTDAPATSSTLTSDVISAYAATAAKIGSWVVVLGLVYRYIDPAEFAMLALIRGTIGILNYTSLGLSPAMIRMLAEGWAAKPQAAQDSALSYYSAEPDRGTQSLYANGLMIALITGAVGLVITAAYALVFTDIYSMPDRLRYRSQMFFPVLWIGCGTLLRLMSDAPGSVLQSHGLIAKDNWRLVEAEIAWVILSFAALRMFTMNTSTSAVNDGITPIAFCYTLSGVILLLRRVRYAQKLTGLWLPQWRLVDEATLKRLLGFGALVLFAQLADYLYAPCDYILINLFLGWDAVAAYAPAMTIDSGLLLLVSGLSSVILPRSAVAHTSGQADVVRRYYVWGTLGSAFLLFCAALIVWLMSPLLFKLWLGNPMTATQAILPLVLIHTVVGGSSAVGRSILLGMGKVRPFTIAVLIAGVGNVVLSYILVRYLGLGLKGIIYGTIVVVVARCLLWQPWYVLRSLRRE